MTHDKQFSFKSMIKCIFDNVGDSYINVLDIGCGTCNFKNFYEELASEKYFKSNQQLSIKNSTKLIEGVE